MKSLCGLLSFKKRIPFKLQVHIIKIASCGILQQKMRILFASRLKQGQEFEGGDAKRTKRGVGPFCTRPGKPEEFGHPERGALFEPSRSFFTAQLLGKAAKEGSGQLYRRNNGIKPHTPRVVTRPNLNMWQIKM